jgi:hypothetical protein
MAGKRVEIAWEVEDTPEALRQRYRNEEEGEVRTRLQALWLLRTGWNLEQVAEVTGVHYRTVQRWVGWYRQGGTAEVCVHHGGGHGQPSWLTAEQEAAVAEEAAKGAFTTAADVPAVGGGAVRSHLPAQRNLWAAASGALPPQGPPAHSYQGEPRSSGSLEKGGCGAALRTAGITTGERLAWADEMRVGLVSMVRRVWAPVGVKVRQPVQQVRQWRYLVVAIEVWAGRLWWCWTESMRSQETASVVRGWQQNTDLKAVVWDGAASHRSEVVQEVGFPLVQQPAYAPELNPAERLFEELRRVVEGKVYDTLAAKVAVLEAELPQWDADPARVSRLVGWSWIMDTLNQLPHSQPSVA